MCVYYSKCIKQIQICGIKSYDPDISTDDQGG